MNSTNEEIHSLAYNCTEKVFNVLRKGFCFSTTTTTSICYLNAFSTILPMDKPSKRKLAKNTLSSKEDMESELNRKLPEPSSWVPVQPAPLAQSEVFPLPVGVSDTAAPTFDGTSNMEASSGVYPDEGYDYGDQYGGYQATRYNSTQVETTKLMRGPITGTTGIISLRRDLSTRVLCAFLRPQGRGLRASHDEPQRESQAPQALDRMERIMERMERQQAAACSASSKQLQVFIGQGEIFSIILLKFLKNYSFTLYSFPWSLKSVILSTLHCGKRLGGRRLPGGLS
jgi:hypothetical protein